jgi:hypothetical protein
MATPAQLEANRRNSQLSTGPRTETGKITSSRNSTRTGLYAKSLLIDGEDPEELAALQQDYLDSCDPQGAVETALVLELLRCDWLLRRMDAIETQLWNSSTEEGRRYADFTESQSLLFAYDNIEERLVVLQRRAASLSRAFHCALRDLTRLQSLRAKRPAPTPPDPAATEIGFVSPTMPPTPPPAPRNLLHPPPDVLNLSSSYSSHIANPRRTRPLPLLSSSLSGSALFV